MKESKALTVYSLVFNALIVIVVAISVLVFIHYSNYMDGVSKIYKPWMGYGWFGLLVASIIWWTNEDNIVELISEEEECEEISQENVQDFAGEK